MNDWKKALRAWVDKFNLFMLNPNVGSREKIIAVQQNQESRHHVSTGTGKSRPRGDRKLFPAFMEAVPQHILDAIWDEMDSKYKVIKVSDTKWIVNTPRTRKVFGCGVAATKKCNSMRMDNTRKRFINPWRDTGTFKLPT